MKKVSLLLLFMICIFAARAQKVAVVLSGGGSKGVMHIGVLRALEESGIPIDYIAGTSMGAIIGGLYASGYSPDQMHKIITSDEFTKWISGKLDEHYIYFFRQGQPDPSWLSFKFKYDSVLQTRLPSNIVSPVRMDFAFLELFSASSAVAGYDFNNLMVPFRCVAADIRHNKPYILKQGDLGSSIRASMTFPFYFKPIRIDGRLLFDGGMYNNFPSDVVLQDFNPDIIIGSKAAGNYPPPKEDDVVSQLATMLMGPTNFDLYCDASVMIAPKLKVVNVIDFSNTEALIDSGYVAALRQIPEIRKFVLDTVTEAMHDSIRSQFNARKHDLRINKVDVHGLEQGQAAYVENAIMGEGNSRKTLLHNTRDIDINEAKAGYFKVLGENRLKSAFPTLRFDSISNRYKLVIDAQYENNIKADFGGSLSSGGSNEIFLQLKYGIWKKVASQILLNGSFGRFYNSVLAGGRIELPGGKPFYFDAQYNFNQFNYYRTKSFFFGTDSPSFLYVNNSHLRFDVGFPVTYKGKIEAGITLGINSADYFQTNTATVTDKEDRTKFSFYSPYFEIEFNTLNRKQYSNKGGRLFSSIQFVGGVEKNTSGTTSVLQGDYTGYHNYFIVKLMYDKYFLTGKVYHPGISIEAQANNLGTFRNYTSTSLYMPVYSPVYEMATIYQSRYRPDGFAAFGLRNVFCISKNIDFRLEGFLMAPFRQISSNQLQQTVKSNLFPSLTNIISTTLVYNSPIGPLSASLNYYDDGSPISFFVNLGFIIFNRPAF